MEETRRRFLAAVFALGATRRERAQRLGMTERQMQNYEHGHTRLMFEALERFERAGIITIHAPAEAATEQAA